MVIFSDQRGPYGFLSNSYPSPFYLDGERWGTVWHCYWGKLGVDVRGLNVPSQVLNKVLDEGTYMDPRYGVMRECVREKFEQNPDLKDKLLSIKGNIDFRPYRIGDIPRGKYWEDNLGGILMEYRDAELDVQEEVDIRPEDVWDRLRELGYDIPEGENRVGKVPTYRETRSGLEVNILFDIDIYSEYSKAKLESIAEYSYSKQRPDRYVIVAKRFPNPVIRNIEIYGRTLDILFFTVSELMRYSSEHFLNPPIEVIRRGGIDSEPIPGMEKHREFVDAHDDQLTEISVNDLYIKEQGITKGSVILVHDFSPHYRKVK